MELFPRCASGTYSKSITIDMAKLQVDMATYESMKKDLDDSNRWFCAATLKAIKDMNDLCVNVGVNKIYDGQSHMEALELFCGNLTKEYFDQRIC